MMSQTINQSNLGENMKKTIMLAALVVTSAAFAGYSQQGYYDNQATNQAYNQTQPYYQSQGNTYYQTQPNYQTQDGYYQTQPQTQYYNQGGYVSQADTTPTMTSTPNMQPAQTTFAAGSQQDFGATEQDKQINTKIRDRLKNLGIQGYETIIFKTQNGIVMISGSVDKVDDLMKIRDLAKSVEGVKTVNNQVTAKTK